MSEPDIFAGQVEALGLARAFEFHPDEVRAAAATAAEERAALGRVDDPAAGPA